MKQLIKAAAIIGMSVGIMGNVSAASYTFDYTSGSSLYTADDGTMTEWLQLDQYTTTSFDDLNSLFASDVNLAGYSLASIAEVDSLTNSLFGSTWSYMATVTGTAESSGWTDTVAQFFDYSAPLHPNGPYAMGLTSDPTGSSSTRMRLASHNPAGTTTDYVTAGTVSTSFETNASAGYFASRTVSPVPEPSTLALMLAGFGLIGFKSHRRNKLSA